MKMKWIKPFIFLTIPTIFLIISPVIYNMVRYRYCPMDAFLRTIIRENNTIWAPGFSESKYSSIRTGMTKEQIIKILGEPVRKWDRDYPDGAWSYSWQKEGDDIFDRRDITFSRDGQVTGVYREFYMD